MAKDLQSPQDIPAELAEEALEQMFGYYSRETGSKHRAIHNGPPRVISELDAAGAILAAKRAA